MSTVRDVIARVLEAPLVVRDALEPADAIVVLGAPLWRDGSLSPILAERVEAAIELWRAGAGRYVVATGGITQGRARAEADAIAEELRAAGVPDVLVEHDSRSTAENARYTARLLHPLGVKSLWLVTQPFHGRRAAHLFRHEGFDVRVWHIADSMEYRDRRRAMRWLLREYASWCALYARRLTK
ncbi:MAG: YdcF family protein [Kofleriaceae bacterium]|nr:YdcF family protein [Kofleriaceae bacterium]